MLLATSCSETSGHTRAEQRTAPHLRSREPALWPAAGLPTALADKCCPAGQLWYPMLLQPLARGSQCRAVQPQQRAAGCWQTPLVCCLPGWGRRAQLAVTQPPGATACPVWAVLGWACAAGVAEAASCGCCDVQPGLTWSRINSLPLVLQQQLHVCCDCPHSPAQAENCRPLYTGVPRLPCQPPDSRPQVQCCLEPWLWLSSGRRWALKQASKHDHKAGMA